LVDLRRTFCGPPVVVLHYRLPTTAELSTSLHLQMVHLTIYVCRADKSYLTKTPEKSLPRSLDGLFWGSYQKAWIERFHWPSFLSAEQDNRGFNNHESIVRRIAQASVECLIVLDGTNPQRPKASCQCGTNPPPSPARHKRSLRRSDQTIAKRP
jgi:hypothetical protein